MKPLKKLALLLCCTAFTAAGCRRPGLSLLAAVYFRKSNPPEAGLGPRSPDRRAHRHEHVPALGHVVAPLKSRPANTTGATTIRMMDLAAQNGHQSGHRRIYYRRARVDVPQVSQRSIPRRATVQCGEQQHRRQQRSTGGFPGLVPRQSRRSAPRPKNFIIALVEHYRNHPALLGYDLWNENTYGGGSPTKMYCYCEATKRKLREWLRARYAHAVRRLPDKVGLAWNRYSYASWDDVEPPPNFGGYSESLDWLSVPH